MTKSFWVLAIWLSIAATDAAASIPDFLDELYMVVQSDYASLRATDYAALCASQNLAASDTTNQRTYFRIHFLHDLLTTVNARDYARGGFLQIPYFWHWTDPNPRHAIVSLPDSNLLTAQRPPAPYERYATRADIDRVPTLFLSDLFAESPGYAHPDCGSFFSFGWCSEREMAFTALATAWGYECKIWQSGIHTYSVVRCELVKTAGRGSVILNLRIDNTFDTIGWQSVPESTSLNEWREDVGSGAQIGWYNHKARSAEQIEFLRSMAVGAGAKARIREQVRSAVPRVGRDD